MKADPPAGITNMCIRDRDKLNGLEYDLFCQIRDSIAGEIDRIQRTAKAIARLDVLCSLSLSLIHI